MSPEESSRRGDAGDVRIPRETPLDQHTPLGAGPEFDAIRRMLERWGPKASGVGDDAAVIRSIGEHPIVLSTDTSVENVHFRRDWLSAQEIGYRATAAALSDLAAMGARPLGIVVALTVPDSWRSEFDELADGIGEAAVSVGAPILGGDTTRGTELSLTITVLGVAQTVLLRSSAKAGDRVYVTGRLGGPLAALRDFQSGREPSAENRRRFAVPQPRIEEAVWLAENGATSAIDISDGLAAELGHLAAASRAQISARLENLPVVDGSSPLDAAVSGEEYELVVTSPSAIDTEEFSRKFKLELTEIGEVGAGAGVVMTLNGEPVALPPGYLHFTK